jgi:hypothetical protein
MIVKSNPLTDLHGTPFIAALPEAGPEGDHAESFEPLSRQLQGAATVLFPRVSIGDLDRFFWLRLLQILRREPPLNTLSIIKLTAETNTPPLAGGFAARFRSSWPFTQCIFVTESGDPVSLAARIGLPINTETPLHPDTDANPKIALQLQRIWGRCGSTTGFENQIESLVGAGFLTIRLFSDAVRRRGATLNAQMEQIITENSVHAGAHINVLAVPDGPPLSLRSQNPEAAWATWLAATAACRIHDPMVAEVARRADAVIANHLECVGPAITLAPEARLLLDIRDDRARATAELMGRDGRSEAHIRIVEAAASRAQARVLAIPDICGHVSVSEFERLSPLTQRSAILLPRVYTEEVQVAADPRFDVLLFGDEHPFNITSVRWFLDAVWRPYLAPAAIRVAITGRVGAHVKDNVTSDVRILGFVDDLDAIRGASRLTVVPDRHGTGTAVKTLATLAAGHPLVTTSVGVRGLDPSVAAILPAHDDPSALAADILALLRDPERLKERRQRVHQAQQAIRRGPDHAALLATIPRPTPRVQADRQAQWAQVVAAAMQPDPRPHYFAPGVSFPMSGSPADHHVLVDGWHSPEPWGRWTDGAEASLRITLAAPTEALLALEFDLAPSPMGGMISLNIDGTDLSPIQPRPGPAAWPIPANLTRGKTSFLATLRVSETICPAQKGDSTDNRILGIGVSAVRLIDYDPSSVQHIP